MYHTALSPNGYYTFVTDTNLSYYCRFINCTNALSPLLGVYDIKIYEIDFYPAIPENVSRRAKAKDPKIAATITALIKQTINDDVVIISICDSSDGREFARHKLFEKWHIQHVTDKIIRIPVEITLEVNNITVYACAYHTHNFKYPHLLQEELIDKSFGIIAEKYGE